ncbi:alpha amylase N-terminal ig-like domain-containing protein [Orenia marismortui]|uniref:Alpha-glucosidase n=1 Tax=Orenia marismortui TaxID=46469 RepID=A0A4R8HAA2_9FIRM|nr:alpha amylase N-terminal ig-like domain-containing protein [Orenia marismortui]TDX52332.1 alpha-glucosidase [Orenia marismortui]
MNFDWKESIYSDGSRYYIDNPTPELGDIVKIKLRVLSSAPVDKVFLRTVLNGDDHLIEMKVEQKKKGFRYYSCKLEISQPRINYHFYISTQKETYFYNQLEVSTHIPIEDYDFVIVAGYKAPEWIKSTVFYQIFPDRFYNGNPANDVKDNEYEFDGHSTIQRDWSEIPGDYEDSFCLDFFGGDLEGIKAKIPYLKELGVNALYLNPIFYAATHHKYDCLDYFKVDPHFGGDKALIELIEELHKNDMRIILDTSVNHTGTAHKWFNKEGSFYSKDIGAYHNEDSKEREYYYFDEDNNYHGWAGVDTLPTLNYTSEELRDMIYQGEDSVIKHWLKPPFNIDGWRLDVANTMGRMNEKQMHHEIWPEIRKSIREENSQAYILGEHWTDDREFLKGDEWDSSMNYYGFGRPVRQFLGELDRFLSFNNSDYKFKSSKKKAKDISQMFMQKLARLPHQIAYLQFNLFDSHDIHRLHNNPEISWDQYRGAVMMLFTFPGTPNIYYGDEVGLDGRIDTFEGCRYPMEWDAEKQNQNYYKLYNKLALLKQEEDALQEGGFKLLYDQGYVLSYARFTDEKAYLVVISQDNNRTKVEIPVFSLGIGEESEIKEVFNYSDLYNFNDGKLEIELDAKESLLFEITI